uniref:Uncharacterized protein n=1 Tax=Nelumbo nucifera TaxID=4432 RepID=A0A822YJQ1_NELNU|nr:TPA_asm: hypothetical protein HUJ06_011661 [Nelumbo nucifera]
MDAKLGGPFHNDGWNAAVVHARYGDATGTTTTYVAGHRLDPHANSECESEPATWRPKLKPKPSAGSPRHLDDQNPNWVVNNNQEGTYTIEARDPTYVPFEETN